MLILLDAGSSPRSSANSKTNARSLICPKRNTACYRLNLFAFAHSQSSTQWAISTVLKRTDKSGFLIHDGQVENMRNVPPDEYNGAVVYLQYRGYRITPVDSFASIDSAAPGTRVGRKTLTAEEVISLAFDKGWMLP